MNTSGFHQNVGEGNKSLNAMSPDPLLSEAFGKGSGLATKKASESRTPERDALQNRIYQKIIFLKMQRLQNARKLNEHIIYIQKAK